MSMSTWRNKSIFVYVDDLLIIGDLAKVQNTLQTLGKIFCLKDVGSLDKGGSSIVFLGRELKRVGDSIAFKMKTGYLDADFENFRLMNCRSATVPGSSTVKHMYDGDEALAVAAHRYYRQIVGRLQWLCPIRPDICFSVKELARNLNAPTKESEAQVKHLLRYLKGTQNYQFVLRPQYPGDQKSIEIEAFSDSDWAGCSKTRKSTSGFILQIFGTTIHFGSRTQSIHALSSGEAELYALGTSTSEALHIKHNRNYVHK